MRHDFTVHVDPMPAPRMSSSDRYPKKLEPGGKKEFRPIVKKYHRWKDALLLDLQRQGLDPIKLKLAATVRLDVLAFFEMPGSWRDREGQVKGTRRQYLGNLMREECDADNVLKAVSDTIFSKAPKNAKFLSKEEREDMYPDDQILGTMACECRWEDMLGPRILIRIYTHDAPSLFDYDPRAPEARKTLVGLAKSANHEPKKQIHEVTKH